MSSDIIPGGANGAERRGKVAYFSEILVLDKQRYIKVLTTVGSRRHHGRARRQREGSDERKRKKKTMMTMMMAVRREAGGGGRGHWNPEVGQPVAAGGAAGGGLYKERTK